MQKRISEEQILESILKWSNYLIESGEMSEEEVKALLGEGLVKRFGQAIKNTAKAGVGFVGNSFKHVFGDIGKFMHDMVLANKGIAKLIKCIGSLKGKVKNIGNVKLVALLEGKVYPIHDLAIPDKFKKVLVLAVNPAVNGTLDGAMTIRSLQDTIKGVGAKNLSSWVDGVVLGTEAGGLDESSKSKSKKKSPTKPTSIKLDAENLGIKTTDGESYVLATNKLLDVVTNGKDIIAFKFDVTEETKKARKEDDDLLT